MRTSPGMRRLGERLLGVSARVIDRLEALGLKVVALEPRTQDDVRRVVQKVGAVLGRVAESERLARRIDAEVDAAAAMVPKAQCSAVPKSTQGAAAR